MKGKKDHDAAAQEAHEEAGVKGKVYRHPMGAYLYEKRRSDGAVEPVRVMVYLLEVLEEKDRWREADQRQRAWMKSDEAARLVEEPGLADPHSSQRLARRAGSESFCEGKPIADFRSSCR